MQKKKDLLSSDFYYMLVIFLFISAGIAYLFYSLGYSNAVEQMGLSKIQNLQEATNVVDEEVDNS